MNSSLPRTGILGGTFDPIHLGHLAVADAAASALDLRDVLVIPSNHPPHRRTEPLASAFHRFAMVALATADRPAFVSSDLELRADSWSYTSITLGRLRADGLSAGQLFFITGADAFAEIATWNNYPAILDQANFVVVSRPGHPALEVPRLLPALAERMVVAGGAGARDGAGPDRTAIWLLDAPTPDVSSTDVRHRAAKGESLAGLVPRLVEHYIERHRLYR